MSRHARKSSSTKSAQPPNSSRFACPSCAAETLGSFCSQGGEKEASGEDYSISHYLEELLLALTLLESKVLRSVWLVISRPGYLSSEHFQARRVRYVKPIQLFILMNFVYYFSLTQFDATTFTTPLATQIHMNNYYPGYASTRVDQKLQQDNISHQALETKYNQKTNVLSKTLIFLLIPIFALLFYALFFKKRKYLVQHAVVATHFWAFNLILLGVILPLVSVLLIRLCRGLNVSAAPVTNDGVVSTILQICLAAYLFLMLRRAYAASGWYCAAAAVALGWSFFHIVWLYRFFLFNLTLSVV
jgi:hypothetical protein